MDEELLQQNLEQYKAQFLQIQSVLENTGEENQEDLVKLRDDLVELIHVSEESLLSLKKSKLLQLLDSAEEEVSNIPERLNESACSSEVGNDTEVSDDKDLSEVEDDITGMKCRISYTQDWGVTEQHNAMVFDAETVELADGNETTKVRVLFMNPTHKSMVPCPYFLDGKCRFSDDDCRYSHGYLLDVEDLLPFKEPDFSKVECGKSCLARYDDGVWYKATIQSFDHDDHTFVVHYDTYNSDATLSLDAVLPLDQQDAENVSDSENVSSCSSDSEESEEAKDDDGEDVAVVQLSWKPSGGPVSLGEWEQHTKGIGSKLMAKMGYIFGKGLGRDGNGIVEPVEAVVLPQGKSLDKIAQLRENNKLPKPGKKKQKRTPKMNNIKLPEEVSGGDIFDFINIKLGGKRGNIQDIRVPVAGTSASDFEVKESDKKKKGGKNINWNLQLFKTHEEISSVEKKLKKEEMALSRHEEKDKKTASHFRQKIAAIKAHLSRLHEKEKSIQEKLHHKKNHRKLTVF